jgi:hypothetical protein
VVEMSHKSLSLFYGGKGRGRLWCSPRRAVVRVSVTGLLTVIPEG